MPLCALSVDLDEIPNYFAIHGLAPPVGQGATAVYDIALERLDAFARAADVPLTLFAIGSDLTRPASAARLRYMANRGHEVANHTQDHLYDLTRQSRSAIAAQIADGVESIAQATGYRPTGFRAPGYTVNDVVFDVLAELEVAYGSSVFPCPPYYLAKAAALLKIKLMGRDSRSVLDVPSVLRAPTEPYRVGRPYWTRGSGILELPVQVTRGPRLPFIGTTLVMAGPAHARLLSRMVAGAPLVNLELHGIDVLDAGDGFPELLGHQFDAGISHQKKLASLVTTVEALREAGYSFVRLDEAAAAFARPAG
jgi:peptidoglycan/xylan/chitin deacetylase (PgdA/CDA1 family)